MKKCCTCKEVKPLDSFYNDATKPDGKTSRCKPCQKQGAAKNYWSNRDKHREYHYVRYRALRPKDRRTFEEYIAQKKAEGKGRKVAALKYAHKRRIQILERASSMSELDTFVFEEAASLCKEREETTGIKWHVDHIVPLNHRKASGLHCAANFQVVPASWNFRKCNTSFAEYDFT